MYTTTQPLKIAFTHLTQVTPQHLLSLFEVIPQLITQMIIAKQLQRSITHEYIIQNWMVCTCSFYSSQYVVFMSIYREDMWQTGMSFHPIVLLLIQPHNTAQMTGPFMSQFELADFLYRHNQMSEGDTVWTSFLISSMLYSCHMMGKYYSAIIPTCRI